jgi:predicted nucleic acid-binding protein
MQETRAVKIFLDSSILRIFTPGNDTLSYLAMFPMLGCPVEVVLSSYTLSETLETLSRPNVPPKARIAVIQGLAFGMLQGNWHVRLEDPDPVSVNVMGKYCRDENDWPVLADALAESCDFLVTRDRDLLDIGDEAPVTCIDPGALQAHLESNPAIRSYMAQFPLGFNMEPSPF